jgi:flavin reductase (DIM6/NTAB) family NADH-FMN oxidoreductase RutF
MSSKRVSESLAAVDSALYRRTCAQFATGITVVTVVDSAGRPHGMTVNSFSSVSLDPPLVLVSIDLRNAILGHFLATAFFAINILAERQEHLSQRFSTTSANRFDGIEWHAASSGTPLLDDALAHLECAVVRTFEVGDHTILIGEVLRAGHRAGKPLVYFDRRYQSLSDQE